MLTGAASLAAAALVLTGCATGAPNAEQLDDDTLTVVAHDSFALDEQLLADFQTESGIEVTIVNSGSSLEMVSKVVLTNDDPLGDVVVGVSSDDASRLANDDQLIAYTSPNSANGSADFSYQNTDWLTAIDRGNVCMNLDEAWFADSDVAKPVTFEDLAEPEYQDLTVVASPAASSVGLAFLLATIGHFGEDGWQEYWSSLQENGVKIASDWEDTYYNEFSFSGGERPIALSYSSSPAYTVNEEGTASSTSAMLDTCYQQVEYAGILARSQHVNSAKKFIDFLLTEEIQATIPETMYMYPVDANVTLPTEWEFAPAAVEDQLASLDSALVVENRETWVTQWADLFS